MTAVPAGDRPCCPDPAHALLSTGERAARHEYRDAVRDRLAGLLLALVVLLALAAAVGGAIAAVVPR